MPYLPINHFEVNISDCKNEVCEITFKINNSNFFMFPYYKKNIESEIIDKFLKIIDGKEITISLSFDLHLQNRQSNILQFNNECIVYNTVQSYENGDNLPSIQETYFVFENNSIVRNALRKFVYDYK